MNIINNNDVPKSVSNSINISNTTIDLPELTNNKTEALKIIDKQLQLNKQFDKLKPQKRRRRKSDIEEPIDE